MKSLRTTLLGLLSSRSSILIQFAACGPFRILRPLPFALSLNGRRPEKKVEALQAFVLIFHRPLDIASRTTMYKCLVLSMLLHLMYLHFTQLAKELAKV